MVGEDADVCVDAGLNGVKLKTGGGVEAEYDGGAVDDGGITPADEGACAPTFDD